VADFIILIDKLTATFNADMILFAFFLPIFTNVGGLTFWTLHTVENL